MRHGLRETNGLIGFLSPLAGATHVFDWSGVPANTEDEHLPRMVGGWAAYNTNQYEGLRDGLSAFVYCEGRGCRTEDTVLSLALVGPVRSDKWA